MDQHNENLRASHQQRDEGIYTNQFPNLLPNMLVNPVPIPYNVWDTPNHPLLLQSQPTYTLVPTAIAQAVQHLLPLASSFQNANLPINYNAEQYAQNQNINTSKRMSKSQKYRYNRYRKRYDPNQNAQQRSGHNQDSPDLRQQLVRKRRLSESFNTNDQEDYYNKGQSSRNNHNNWNDNTQEGTSIQINLAPLKSLTSSDSGSNKWYIVVDTDVIVQNYNYLNNMTATDPDCQLLIPHHVILELRALAAEKENVQERRVLRFLKDQIGSCQIKEGEEEAGESASHKTMMTCKKLASQHNHVILITSRLGLCKHKMFTKDIYVFTMQEIKDILAKKTTKLPRVKSPTLAVKITVPNELSEKINTEEIHFYEDYDFTEPSEASRRTENADAVQYMANSQAGCSQSPPKPVEKGSLTDAFVMRSVLVPSKVDYYQSSSNPAEEHGSGLSDSGVLNKSAQEVSNSVENSLKSIEKVDYKLTDTSIRDKSALGECSGENPTKSPKNYTNDRNKDIKAKEPTFVCNKVTKAKKPTIVRNRVTQATKDAIDCNKVTKASKPAIVRNKIIKATKDTSVHNNVTKATKPDIIRNIANKAIKDTNDCSEVAKATIDTSVSNKVTKDTNSCTKVINDTNHCTKVTKDTNICDKVTKDTKLCTKVTKDTNLDTKITKDANICTKVTKDTSPCTKVTKDNNPCIKVTRDTNPCTKVTKDTNMSTKVTKDTSPCTKVTKDNNPCIKVTRDTNPCTKVTKDTNISTKVTKDTSPCTKVTKDNNPCIKVVKDTNPCTKVTKDTNISTEVTKDTSPCTKVTKDNNPCIKVAKDTNPCTKVTKDTNISTKVTKDTSPCTKVTKDNNPCIKVTRDTNPCTKVTKDTNISTKVTKDTSPCTKVTKDNNPCIKVTRDTNPCTKVTKDTNISTKVTKDTSPCTKVTKDNNPCIKVTRDTNPCTKVTKDTNMSTKVTKDTSPCTKVTKDNYPCIKVTRDTNPCTKVTKDTNICDKVTKDTKLCTKVTKDTNLHTKITKDANICTKVTKDTSPYNKVTKDTIPYNKVAKDTSPYNKVTKDTSPYKKVTNPSPAKKSGNSSISTSSTISDDHVSLDSFRMKTIISMKRIGKGKSGELQKEQTLNTSLPIKSTECDAHTTNRKSVSRSASYDNDNTSEASIAKNVFGVNVTVEETSTSGISNSESSHSDNFRSPYKDVKKVTLRNVFMFSVGCQSMEDVLKTRSDEWVFRFVQIMEEVLRVKLQEKLPSDNKEYPAPRDLQEAARCIIAKYSNNFNIVNAANKLSFILYRMSDENGKIAVTLDPADYMEMYSYGVFLVETFQDMSVDCKEKDCKKDKLNIPKEDTCSCYEVNTASESLKKLLYDIQNAKIETFVDHPHDDCPENIALDPCNDLFDYEIGTREEMQNEESSYDQQDQLQHEVQFDKRTSPNLYNLRSQLRKSQSVEDKEVSPNAATTGKGSKKSFFNSLQLVKTFHTNVDKQKSPAKIVSSEQEQNSDKNIHKLKVHFSKQDLGDTTKLQSKVICNFTVNEAFERKVKARQNEKVFEEQHIENDNEKDNIEDAIGDEVAATKEDEIHEDNNDIHSESNKKFMSFIGRITRILGNVFTNIKLLCDEYVKQVKRNEHFDLPARDMLHQKVNKACIFINNIYHLLDSIDKRELQDNDNNIQKLLKVANVVDFIPDELCSEYRFVINKCKETAAEYSKIIQNILKVVHG